MANDQNPYTSALIATASAEAEAKRKLNVAEAAVAAYPDNANYQAGLKLNQEQYAATQVAYNTASTNSNSANAPIAKANAEGQDTGTNGDLRTTGQTQATPPKPLNITNDDNGGEWAPSSSGTGAGTSSDSAKTINSDNNAVTTSKSAQLSVSASTATLNQLIPTQPNQLDQYASYTYSLGWYLLTTQQFNDMMATQRPNVTGWQLLMQSGGAPITGRSPAFPLDYYMDDLEITTLVPMGGAKMAHSATDLRFKVTEPNGITLIQNIFNAVSNAYGTAQQSQTNTTSNGAPVAKTPGVKGAPNYLQAQYCMVIQFYGYDSDGNLVAPAKGAFNTNSQSGGYGQSAVIKKYYPFRLVDIKFQIANRAIEYTITGRPVAQSYGFTTDRGTVPYPFTMAGSTVEQLLTGSKITVGGSSTNTADPGARKDSPQPATVPATLPSIVTGQDNPLATSGGMDFTAGNF
jgi:hypothetical protein